MSDDLISKKKEIEKKYKEQLQKTIFNEEKSEETEKSYKLNSNNKRILSYCLIPIWVLVSSFLVVLLVEFFYPEYGDPKYVQPENIFLVLPIIPRIIILIIILSGISQIYKWGKK
jgi:hypothetical protein